MRAGAEEKQIKALLWLVAACRKYGKIRIRHYYDYAVHTLGLSKDGARSVLRRLEELGLVKRVTMRIIDCEQLWRYIEHLTTRVSAS